MRAQNTKYQQNMAKLQTKYDSLRHHPKHEITNQIGQHEGEEAQTNHSDQQYTKSKGSNRKQIAKLNLAYTDAVNDLNLLHASTEHKVSTKHGKTPDKIRLIATEY
eukprot:240612_1